MFSVKVQPGREAFEVRGSGDVHPTLSLKRLATNWPTACFRVKALLPGTRSGTSCVEVSAVLLLSNLTGVRGLPCQPSKA